MSFKAAAWALEQPIDNTHRKFVLIAIAHHANEHDEAWPSVGSIARRCAMCDKAVRNAIAHLVRDGFLRLSGSTSRRRFHLLRGKTTTTAPAPDTEAVSVAPVSDAAAPVPRSTNSGTGYRQIDQEPENNLSGDADASAAPVAKLEEKPEDKKDGSPTDKLDTKPMKGKQNRGKRLAEDWQPSPADIAAAEQHPALDWRIEAERFRNYWLAKAGKDAAKRDWALTWKNWVINEARYCRERARTAPNAAANAAANAARTAPAALSPDELWAVRLKDFRSTGFWPRSSWGPPPGSEGCRVPAQSMAAHRVAQAAAATMAAQGTTTQATTNNQ